MKGNGKHDGEKASDTHKLDCDDDDDGGETVIAATGEPSSDPTENRLMAPAPGQQLLFRCFSPSSAISQHIKPPSAAGLSEHCHTRGCLFPKSFPPSP